MPKPHHKFVAGFLFDDARQSVLLVRKAYPQVQAGELNGLGGRVLDGEPDLTAMYRTFNKESGLEVLDWKYATLLHGTGTDHEGTEYSFSVTFFFAFSSLRFMQQGRNPNPQEPVALYCVHDLHMEAVVQGVSWIIPMCLEIGEKGYSYISVIETKQETDTLR